MKISPVLRRMMLVAVLVGTVTVPASVAHGQATGRQCPDLGGSTISGEVTSALATEISGITASKSQPGVYWIHNDSGNDAEVFAVNADGDLLMRIFLENTDNWDFEDIAIGPGPDASVDYLYIADVGANLLVRETVVIYRIEEPVVTGGTLSLSTADIERFDYSYANPTGPGTWIRNAESLAVDPVTGDVIVVEKHLTTIDGIPGSSWVYRIRQHELVEDETIIATPMVAVRTRYNNGTIPPTAADFSHDGKVLIVKNHNEVMAWTRNPRQSIFQAMQRSRETDCVWDGPGGEAITVAADGSALYSIPEGNTPNITRVAATLPDPALTCDGVMANVKGTGDRDTLIGTAHRDVIHGRGAADVIEGRGGPDLICGGGGNDVVYGNRGSDRIFGGAGADEVRAGPGFDLLGGNAGGDRLYGQGNGDVLRGHRGDDELRGGSGWDQLNGGPGNDLCGVGGGTGTKTNC